MADRLNVVRLVLRGAFVQIAFGLALGIPVSIAAGKLLSSQLYEWEQRSSRIVDCGGVIGSLRVPGHDDPGSPRPASIDPMQALRTE